MSTIEEDQQVRSHTRQKAQGRPASTPPSTVSAYTWHVRERQRLQKERRPIPFQSRLWPEQSVHLQAEFLHGAFGQPG